MELFEQAPLRSRGDVFGPAPPPRAAGLYAWFFEPIGGVPLDGCLERDGRVLLYVGISPGPPSAAGKVSRENLYKRIRYHFGGVNRYTGNAYGSTLRMTLGCLLADQLGFRLTRVGSGDRLTFTHEGETALSDWIEAHARVLGRGRETMDRGESNHLGRSPAAEPAGQSTSVRSDRQSGPQGMSRCREAPSC